MTYYIVRIKKLLGKYTNMTQIKDIDKHFGYKDTASHWFRTDKSGFSYPSVDDWLILKKILNFDDTYDKLMTTYKYVANRKEIINQLNLKKVKTKGKHTYIFINANKKIKKDIINSLKLQIYSYP